jgi:cytochrome c553
VKRGLRWVALAVASAFLLGMAGPAHAVQASSEARNPAHEKCRGCHVGDATSWKENYHSKMVRPAKDGLIQSAVEHWTRDAKGSTGPRTGNIDGRTYGLDDVVMVVGSKWKQRYLVRLPGTSSHQFLDRQWNAYTRLWETYSNSDDWETVCGACHVKPNGLADVSMPAPAALRTDAHPARQKLQLSDTRKK